MPSTVHAFVISGVAAKVHNYAGVPGYSYEGTLRGAKLYATRLKLSSDLFLKIEDEFGMVAYRLPTKRKHRKWVDFRVKYEIPVDRPIKKLAATRL